MIFTLFCLFNSLAWLSSRVIRPHIPLSSDVLFQCFKGEHKRIASFPFCLHILPRTFTRA